MLELHISGDIIDVEFSTFPGGEEHVRVLDIVEDPILATIVARITSSKELIRLLLLTDAVKSLYPKTLLTLELGYLPYARQDTRFKKGESFSLKLICNMINQLNFNTVLINDCHSPIGVELLTNVIEKCQLRTLLMTPRAITLVQKCDFIVAPDLGASTKAAKIAKYFGKPLIQCIKTRVNRDTIKIDVVANDLTGKTLLVVDDICDGGGTFLALADALESKSPKELNLYVTHGIFSKGKEILLTQYNKVMASDEW